VNGTSRVVFDTNILFSSLGWLGNPHQCVQAARQGKCLSLTCEPILADRNAVAAIPFWFGGRVTLAATPLG